MDGSRFVGGENPVNSMVTMTFREFAESVHNFDGAPRTLESVRLPDVPRLIREEEAGKNRAMIFDRIGDYGRQSVANLFGSSARIFGSVGADCAEEFFGGIDDAIGCPEKIHIAEIDIDFVRQYEPKLLNGRLPPIIHSEEDSAPYITSGVVVARHPITHRHHLCFVRLAIVGDDTLLFNAATPRIREISRLTVEAGLPLDVHILIGAPPKVLLAGALHFPDEVDELEVVQKWAGEQLSFFQHRLPIPRLTEMVLVGRVMPGLQQEGPFGDSFGTYSTRQNPTCKISEVWEQKEPLYHLLLGGVSNEHVELLILKAKHALEHLKNSWDGLIKYSLPIFAGGRLCVLKVGDGQVSQAHLTAIFAVPLIRTVILVDVDIDISSERDILWSLTRRTRGAASFHFHRGVDDSGGDGKVVIDARAKDPSDVNNCRIAQTDLKP